MLAVKLIPNLLSWFVIVLVLLRGFPGRRTIMAASGSVGFTAGSVGAFFLFRAFPGDQSFGIIRDLAGGSHLLLWGVAVAAIYRSTVRDFPLLWGERLANGLGFAGVSAFAAGFMAGAICACRLPGTGISFVSYLVLISAAGVLAFYAMTIEKLLPASFTLPRPSMLTAIVALLLFSSSSIIRVDLFSPLTMKVMKFAHDFVHQFMESMLFPDHLFIQGYLSGYIGLLFGKGVGFWGGLVIWFAPVAIVLLAVRLEPLPSVAHIRQGAQRRRQLATAIGARRRRLVIPLLSLAIFAAAAYQSRFPSVEYWDPKPVPVTATPSGEIVIPKKGDIDLGDGKLHKFLFKQGGKEARFFVLLGPAGKLIVVLDACAICKPDGYGQSEGTVICYYCKTLIPLETVGKPGGCNPVPVSFAEKDDGVHIDSLTLINEWSNTVQSTTKVKEGGK